MARTVLTQHAALQDAGWVSLCRPAPPQLQLQQHRHHFRLCCAELLDLQEPPQPCSCSQVPQPSERSSTTWAGSPCRAAVLRGPALIGRLVVCAMAFTDVPSSGKPDDRLAASHQEGGSSQHEPGCQGRFCTLH